MNPPSSVSQVAPLVPRANARPVLLSIVCPAFNEEANIAALHAAVHRVMTAEGQPFECVFVNDGSVDGTLASMREVRAHHPNTTIVDLSRNFGKEVAMTAGLDHARGDAVVIIDADLQHPPETIPALIEGWREGYEVVYGRRRGRERDSWWRRAPTRLFYRLMHRFSDVTIPDDAGDFRLLSRKAVNAVIALREHHRFMKGVFAWVGFPSKAIAFDVVRRERGASTFNFWRLWNFSLEGITSHTLAPLKASTYIGLVVATFAFLYGGYIIAKTILLGDPVPGFPTVVTLMLFLGGVQLIVLGVIGEYLGRVFVETKNRPLYFANVVEQSAADLPDEGRDPEAGENDRRQQ
jgi:glycosyltransferase involved in cell wall biosynthesis